MSSVITLCSECRTIQKADTICSICGARVRATTPALIVLPPKPRPKRTGTDG